MIKVGSISSVKPCECPYQVNSWIDHKLDVFAKMVLNENDLLLKKD